MSPDGRIEDEYVTLVNPQGRMGATRVHGITAADVAGAPTFAEIAGDVADRIADAIVVAHNVSFDLRFLTGEYEHIGVAMPEVPRLCTLDLAYRFADVQCRKLGFLCEEYGIEIDEHTALGDARAVSQLLMRFLNDARSARARIPFPDSPVAGSGWCSTRASGVSVRRGERSDRRTSALLSKRSVRRAVKISEQRYFDAVELAISDGVLTTEESAALCALALQLGVSARDLNTKFVQSLADGAKADGTVTPAEADEVYTAARLLDIPQADVAPLLGPEPTATAPQNGRHVREGTPVCLLGWFDSGMMAEIFTAATQANLVIRKNITATVGLVVVEAAGKNVARQNRAKALGIPVVTAAEFMRLLERRAVHA
jgi:DNA polymerase-3 subunit epsilon